MKLDQKIIQHLCSQKNIVPFCPIKLCERLDIKLSTNSLEELEIDIPQNLFEEDYLLQGKLHKELMAMRQNILQRLKNREEKQVKNLKECHKKLEVFIKAQQELSELQNYKKKSEDLEKQPHNRDRQKSCHLAWQAYLKASTQLSQFKPFLDAKLWMYQHHKK